MKSFIIAAGLLIASIQLGFGQASASHRAAAEAMLVASGQAKSTTDAIDQMLGMQFGQGMKMKDYAGVMKTFFAKYMSWDTLKEETIKLYTDEFSEEELKKLTAFYRTEVGKKLVTKEAVISQKSSALNQQRMMGHMPELLEAIRKRQEELKKEKN